MSVRIVYLNDDHDIVSADQATFVVETHLDDAGEVVSEKWGRVVRVVHRPRIAIAKPILGAIFGGIISLLASSVWLMTRGGDLVGGLLLALGLALTVLGLTVIVRQKGS